MRATFLPRLTISRILRNLRPVGRDVSDRFRHGELWELWFVALMLITLVAILSQPLVATRPSLSDFRPGDDPFDIRPAQSERESSRTGEQAF